MPEENDASSNPQNDDHLAVAGETASRDDTVPLDPTDETTDLYQDDLDTSDSKVDPVMAELTDDPTEELGVPPEEFKNELDKYDVDETNDDRREAIEDMDESDDNAASAPQ